MDDLLSQIEEPVYTAIQSKTNATTSNINRPLETIVSKEVPSSNGIGFKRFKSENELAGMSTPKPQNTLKSDSSNGRGWKRNYSSPDARMPGRVSYSNYSNSNYSSIFHYSNLEYF